MPPESTGGADIAALLQDYVPRAEYEAALSAIESAVSERDEAITQRDQHTTRLKDLESKVRGRSYRDAFEKLRKDAKVRDDFADHVFKLLELPQDRDEPDERDIRSKLDAFLKDNKAYVGPAEPEKPRTLERGEGSTRGKPGAPGEPEFRVRRSELNSARWMRDHQDAVHKATQAGLLIIDED